MDVQSQMYYAALGSIQRQLGDSELVNTYLNRLVRDGWLSRQEAGKILQEVDPVVPLMATELTTYCPVCGAVL